VISRRADVAKFAAAAYVCCEPIKNLATSMPWQLLRILDGPLAAMFGCAVDSVAFKALGKQNEAERTRLKSVGKRAKGLVKEVWAEDGNCNVTYTFDPEGMPGAVEKTETVYGQVLAPPRLGSEIEIVYDPAAPQYSMLAERPR
jgi:hypothetical protein